MSTRERATGRTALLRELDALVERAKKAEVTEQDVEAISRIHLISAWFRQLPFDPAWIDHQPWSR